MLLSDMVSDGYFNPRSHEGSDGGYAQMSDGEVISIHAPTRGATGDVALPRVSVAISIHAPTRGATGWDGERSASESISIHAPTRGATICQCTISLEWEFQSTLPRGERQQFSPKSSLFSQQKLSKIFNLNNKLF